MVKNKPQRPDRNIYLQTLIDETLVDLGREVHHFRNLNATISSSPLGKEINPDILFIIDGIYQSVLDNIVDYLANADDLHAARVAISGLEKSVRVRRGFLKKTEIYKE